MLVRGGGWGNHLEVPESRFAGMDEIHFYQLKVQIHKQVDFMNCEM